MKILIVDDTTENLYMLEALLKGNGYEVVSAANGREALEKIRTVMVDMIISDILMPEMDGFRFCREVKGDETLKDIPFFFYTATYTDLVDEELALEVGADKFIRKPVEPEEFIKIIQGPIRDAEEGKLGQQKPLVEEEKEVFKLYRERLVNKLEQKMLDLEVEINERKRAEEELEKHREHLEELVKERTNELEATQEELVKHEKLAVLGQLTATVSHELRNPLGVIRSSAFYVESKLSDVDAKIIKHLKRIEEQVGLCDSIIGDLFEYTRGRRSEMLEGELNPFLEEVLDGMTFPEPVHMLREMAPDLPKVSFDREKLQRVVNNLVTNAIQSVVVRQEGWKEEEVSYQPQVKLATSVVEKGVSIEVEDNGAGMDEETAAQVFEPLFTTRARGSGLGLAIVKKIVEEHGGSISIDSELNKGTKAIVVIPVSNQIGKGKMR